MLASVAVAETRSRNAKQAELLSAPAASLLQTGDSARQSSASAALQTRPTPFLVPR